MHQSIGFLFQFDVVQHAYRQNCLNKTFLTFTFLFSLILNLNFSFPFSIFRECEVDDVDHTCDLADFDIQLLRQKYNKSSYMERFNK